MADEDPDLGPEAPEAPQPDDPAEDIQLNPPEVPDPTESLPSVEESFEIAEDRVRLFVAAVVTANLGTLLLGISGLVFFSGGEVSTTLGLLVGGIAFYGLTYRYYTQHERIAEDES